MSNRHAFAVVLVLLGTMLALQLVLGECIQEDAFISLRYARNLVRGTGLVYNVGERVEGYSNFLWTILLAGGMAAGADPVPLARFLGIGASLALVALTFCAARRLDRSRGVTGGCLAAALVALSPGVIVEGAQGLETIFYTLLVTAGVILAARARAGDAAARPAGPARPAVRLPATAAGAAVLALAALTRPDGLGIFALAALGAFAWRRRAAARAADRLPAARGLDRDEVVALLVFAVIYGPYWLWRFHYYGLPFPNTFYAKTGGGVWHILRGLEYVGRFLLYNPVLTIIALWAAIPGTPRAAAAPGAQDRPLAALRWIALPVLGGYLAYVVLVGGDFKQTFRFVTPILPLAAILLDTAVSTRAAEPGRRARPLDRFVRARFATAILLGGVLVNAGIQIPLSSDWVGRRTYDLVRRRACGLHLKSIARPGDVLAIHSAGIIPYYSELPTIDMWGVTNAHIAHVKMPDMGRGGRRIGHEKQDDPWVFAQNPTYFVDQYHVITTRPVPELIQRIFPPPVDADIARRYEPRSVPLMLDLGHGVREYWFNFLELKREPRAAGHRGH